MIKKKRLKKLAPKSSIKEIQELILAINHFIEEIEKQKQNELRIQKLKTWQILSRRVAHEIKNPLTPLQLYLEKILKSSSDPSIKEELKKALYQIQKIRSIIHSFSMLGKLPEGKKRLGYLHKEVEKFLEKIPEKNIPISLKIQGEPYPIPLDSSQIERLLLNLWKNSVEAIQEKKKKSSSPFKGKIQILIEYQEKGIKLIFEDNGTGIPLEILPQVREPFFTTKKEGEGIGLLEVEKILSQYGAKMEIKTQVKEPSYTQVILTFPYEEKDTHY